MADTPLAVKRTFWRHIDKEGSIPAHAPELGNCWVWIGRLTKDGYGLYDSVKITKLAHKRAYLLLVGPVPNGLELDHLCHNKACVRPSHLEPVTHAENSHRWKASNLMCRRGHEYTVYPPYITRNGQRQCRKCKAIRSLRSYYQRIADPKGRVKQRDKAHRAYLRRIS